MTDLKSACNFRAREGDLRGSPRVPGVVAMATDRQDGLQGAAGERTLGQDAPMTDDAVFAIFSTTKAITGTACLQLVEEGRLDLDAPAKQYTPDIGKLQVLEGFADDGTPRLRPPKREVTTRMLLLHTAGLGYDFFNANYNRLAQSTASRASSRLERRRCAARSCSTRARAGSMAATSTGPARSSRASRASGSGRSCRSASSPRSA